MNRPCLGVNGNHCPNLATNGPRCPACKRAAKRIRNADRPIARAVVQAEPWCHCTNTTCPTRHTIPCGATTDLTADHVLPLAAGGTNHGQRQTLCRSCNSSKRHDR